MARCNREGKFRLVPVAHLALFKWLFLSLDINANEKSLTMLLRHPKIVNYLLSIICSHFMTIQLPLHCLFHFNFEEISYKKKTQWGICVQKLLSTLLFSSWYKKKIIFRIIVNCIISVWKDFGLEMKHLILITQRTCMFSTEVGITTLNTLSIDIIIF